jgi:kinesin family protein 5
LSEEYANLLEKKIAQESETNETASAVQDLTVGYTRITDFVPIRNTKYVALQSRLEAQFRSKLERRESEIETFQKELVRKEETLQKLTKQLNSEKEMSAELRAAVEDLKTSTNRELTPADLLKKEADLEKIRKQMAQQLSDFDNMKKKLMQNLQQRVDKVIEMEISLDETREQYNNVIRSASTKEQQRKMAFLERNLEQLMSVQKEVRCLNEGEE